MIKKSDVMRQQVIFSAIDDGPKTRGGKGYYGKEGGKEEEQVKDLQEKDDMGDEKEQRKKMKGEWTWVHKNRKDKECGYESLNGISSCKFKIKIEISKMKARKDFVIIT